MRRTFLYLSAVILASIAIYITHSQHRSPPTWGAAAPWVSVFQRYNIDAIPVAPEPYIVKPGDSLWTIANKFKLPHQDTRVVVDVIRELNGLTGPTGPILHEGQALKVPDPDIAKWPYRNMKLAANEMKGEVKP